MSSSTDPLFTYSKNMMAYILAITEIEPFIIAIKGIASWSRRTMKDSVGTLTKRRALEIHGKYKEEEKLIDSERKIMRYIVSTERRFFIMYSYFLLAMVYLLFWILPMTVMMAKRHYLVKTTGRRYESISYF